MVTVNTAPVSITVLCKHPKVLSQCLTSFITRAGYNDVAECLCIHKVYTGPSSIDISSKSILYKAILFFYNRFKYYAACLDTVFYCKYRSMLDFRWLNSPFSMLCSGVTPGVWSYQVDELGDGDLADGFLHAAQRLQRGAEAAG